MAKRKNILFQLIAICIPFAFVLLMEGLVSISGYVDDRRDVFTPVQNNASYLALNPRYVARYFTGFVPSVAFTPFEAKKLDSTFRVFVLGGSSTAGFPYPFYYSFATSLEKRLSAINPGRKVEVVNLGMTAVNSFTIWDLRKIVLLHRPDAVVIYAGHNEYYGAFGAGSNVNFLGGSTTMKRAFLLMKRMALYQAFEKVISGDTGSSDRPTGDRTLMSEVIRNADIRFGDEVFQNGVQQFEDNMTDVVDVFHSASIPLFLGTVVSNIKDQRPLGDNPDAHASFDSAQVELENDNRQNARYLFERARRLDTIRFRAPDEMNQILIGLARHNGVYLVDFQPVFDSLSVGGIPGSDTFVDHLHPTANVHDAMGNVLFNVMSKELGLESVSLSESSRMKMDSLGQSYAQILIDRLLADYPFKKNTTASQMIELGDSLVSTYLKSGSLSDSLAAIMVSRNVSMQTVLNDAVRASGSVSDTAAVLTYYEALLYWEPFNTELMKQAAAFALSEPKFDLQNERIVRFGLGKSGDIFFWNALAAIKLRGGKTDLADYLMARAEEIDPMSKTMLFNRARYYAIVGDTTMARSYFTRYQSQQAN